MNCKTDADGKVNSILVTIYDSLEQMYGELCLDLDLHSKSGTFKYKKNKRRSLDGFPLMVMLCGTHYTDKWFIGLGNTGHG